MKERGYGELLGSFWIICIISRLFFNPVRHWKFVRFQRGEAGWSHSWVEFFRHGQEHPNRYSNIFQNFREKKPICMKLSDSLEVNLRISKISWFSFWSNFSPLWIRWNDLSTQFRQWEICRWFFRLKFPSFFIVLRKIIH